VTVPVFLAPGTMHCTAESAVVSTILGSCVAVCLWDKHRKLGGMNHFILPRRGTASSSLRYGDVAVTSLLRELERLGSQSADIRAKLFGGAAVLPFGARAETVGSQNVRVALEVLRSHGIPVLARRTGGQRGLYLRFHTAIGRVMVRELAGSADGSRPSAPAATIRRDRSKSEEEVGRFDGDWRCRGL
jgi:chemotaxis protein CheD